MATFAEEVSELIKALQGLRLSSYVDTAGLAILAYDYLLTFEDERALIWASTRSVPKVLFLLSRYLPFVDLSITASHHFRRDMTAEACNFAYQAAGWLINIGIILSELILVVRTWAVYGRSRFITIALVMWMSMNLVGDLVVMGLFMTSIRFSPLPSGLAGCLVTSGNRLITGVWVILLIFEAGIVSLMVYKGIQMYRSSGSSALYLAVFRDGAIFYIYIFALSIANVIVISKVSRDLSTMLASIERVTHAILTQRLLLTLRRMASELGPSESVKLDTAVEFEEFTRVIDTVDIEARQGPVMTSVTLN